MNPSERNAKRVDALLPLAGGKSNKAVAEEVGVNPATIGTWKKDPAFACELARIKELVDRKPMDAHAVLAAVTESSARLNPPAGPVVVSIPAGASARRRRQLIGRAVARALEAGER
ncbi:hypothetical protein [Streptomyces liliifuscus]|uniref:Homeodomain phBC6A51-type domain-containing protein n=1 Tax=Streptomyces liliifuscus TaxID=2797636 RepID=A0A7T7I6N1_9ACTN|nr:hypothetical protein [Streptomyces liliifuscus]QQM41986.1 hypothetical protein JEQ17_22765 [Streptomyces liliifuscus]